MDGNVAFDMPCSQIEGFPSACESAALFVALGDVTLVPTEEADEGSLFLRVGDVKDVQGAQDITAAVQSDFNNPTFNATWILVATWENVHGPQLNQVNRMGFLVDMTGFRLGM